MSLTGFRTSRRAQKSLLVAGLVLASFSLARAQESNSGNSGVVQQAASGSEESVIVTGQRTLRSLLSEAAQETENFYMRLNEVLNDDDFKITCRVEYPAGTSIATKVCRMRYMEELESRRALSQIQGLGTTDTGELTFEGADYDIATEAMLRQEEFQELVLDAVNSDVELNQSVVKLMQLKAAVQNYESPREERRRERD